MRQTGPNLPRSGETAIRNSPLLTIQIRTSGEISILIIILHSVSYITLFFIFDDKHGKEKRAKGQGEANMTQLIYLDIGILKVCTQKRKSMI